jgi:hypothetical protein
VLYPVSNILLDALPDTARRRLTTHLHRVNIPIRTSLYEPNETPKYMHFLTSGIASVVTTTGDGSTTEVGTLGREGAPQAVHLLGDAPVSTAVHANRWHGPANGIRGHATPVRRRRCAATQEEISGLTKGSNLSSTSAQWGQC